MRFRLCSNCGNHVWLTDNICPHCQTNLKSHGIGSGSKAVALLLGLGVMACDSKSESEESANGEDDTGLNISYENDYGVPETGIPYETGQYDNDGDDYPEDLDCDDEDPYTFPGAAELESTEDCMKDADGDGYGDSAPENSNVTPGTDCDDADANVYPGQGC